MELFYLCTNITSEPFSNPHIRKILDKFINQKMFETDGDAIMIDPFARASFTNDYPNFITNDLNRNFKTDYNFEFKDFCSLWDESVCAPIDLVLFDPPYSLRQLKDCYENIGHDLPLWQTQRPWNDGLDLLAKWMAPRALFISLGWNTQGMGTARGFQKLAIYNFEQSGGAPRHNIQLTIEVKMPTLFQYEISEEE